MKMNAIGGLQWYHVLVPRAVDVALLALIGVMLGHLFWALMPAPPVADSIATATSQPRAADAGGASNWLSAITQAHLFGTTVRTAAKPVKAPETRLALTLTGILFSHTPHDSVAIIADDKQQQQFYQPGDDVEQGVALHAIYADHVILERGGKLETLKLNQGGLKIAANDAKAAPADVQPDLAQLRHKLLQNPDSIDQYVRLQPVYQGGQLQGYRVYPNQSRTVFLATGLKPGDLVKSINGIPLNNPGKALGALNQLSQASKVQVSLTRLGRNRTLTVAF